jgi:hypothetical protein
MTNKRIAELREQAFELCKKYDDDCGSDLVKTDEVFQKFAELIVKEMCGMMEQTEDDLYAMDPSERPTEYIEWLYYWRTRFEQHFGVKE